jgi:hypothetical protein
VFTTQQVVAEAVVEPQVVRQPQQVSPHLVHQMQVTQQIILEAVAEQDRLVQTHLVQLMVVVMVDQEEL